MWRGGHTQSGARPPAGRWGPRKSPCCGFVPRGRKLSSQIQSWEARLLNAGLKRFSEVWNESLVVVFSIAWTMEATGRVLRWEASYGGGGSDERGMLVRVRAPWARVAECGHCACRADLPVTRWPRAFLCLQMVWERGCVVIVMLTPLSENGVRQCYHYWPDEGSNLYHVYEVLPGARPPARGRGRQQRPHLPRRPLPQASPGPRSP